jgi:hypothetical protein
MRGVAKLSVPSDPYNIGFQRRSEAVGTYLKLRLINKENEIQLPQRVRQSTIVHTPADDRRDFLGRAAPSAEGSSANSVSETKSSAADEGVISICEQGQVGNVQTRIVVVRAAVGDANIKRQYRLGYHGRATVHGFRAMVSTALNEMGCRPDVIERQLAHEPGNAVRAAYNVRSISTSAAR